MGLTPHQAKRFYDRLGSAQDLQAFYEDRAVRQLTTWGLTSEIVIVTPAPADSPCCQPARPEPGDLRPPDLRG